MPYDGDQFLSTEQRLASTCMHGSEPTWKRDPGEKEGHKQDAPEAEDGHGNTRAPKYPTEERKRESQYRSPNVESRHDLHSPLVRNCFWHRSRNQKKSK